MSIAVLVLLVALLINDYSFVRLFVFAIVLIKLHVEEKILIAHYADYKDYMVGTKRIIPFVY